MGLLGKLFGRKRTSINIDTLDLSGLMRLVNEYGAVIEEQTQTESVVHDESKLPVPKDDMRKVLLRLIASVSDNPQREQLKAGYLMLADFQPGVGSRVIKIDQLDMTGDIEETAAKIAKQAAEVQAWQERSLAELLRLQQDLAGLDAVRK